MASTFRMSRGREMTGRNLAILLAVIFTVGLVAPLGLMLWGFFVGDNAGVLIGAFLFSFSAIFTVPFVWTISVGEK
jgi:hypothetical protein